MSHHKKAVELSIFAAIMLYSELIGSSQVQVMVRRLLDDNYNKTIIPLSEPLRT